MSSSRVRMPSSRSASSSSCWAVRASRLTCSRRPLRRVISPRRRSRSASRAVWERATGRRRSANGSRTRKSRLETGGPAGDAGAPRHASSLVIAQGMLGRLLLRFLLGRPLSAGDQCADLHVHDERLVVVGPDLADDVVVGQRESIALRELLQCGLVVVEEEVVLFEAAQVFGERELDEPSRRVDAPVEVNAGDQCLVDIRKQRVFLTPACLLFADAEEDHVAHAEEAGLLGQARGADQISLHLRKRSLVESGELAKKDVADDEPEHGITEELERLVMTDTFLPGLVRVRLMGERSSKNIGVLKGVPDALLKLAELVVRGQSGEV